MSKICLETGISGLEFSDRQSYTYRRKIQQLPLREMRIQKEMRYMLNEKLQSC